MNAELTKIQNEVVNALAKRGFRVNRVSSFEGEDAPTVFMSKRVKSYSTHMAEVDGAGMVNGAPLSEFAYPSK